MTMRVLAGAKHLPLLGSSLGLAALPCIPTYRAPLHAMSMVPNTRIVKQRRPNGCCSRLWIQALRGQRPYD